MVGRLLKLIIEGEAKQKGSFETGNQVPRNKLCFPVETSLKRKKKLGQGEESECCKLTGLFWDDRAALGSSGCVCFLSFSLF